MILMALLAPERVYLTLKELLEGPYVTLEGPYVTSGKAPMLHLRLAVRQMKTF
jgi:hypothetical protein